MANGKLNLTRDDLALFLKTPRLIRAFEQLLEAVNSGGGGGGGVSSVSVVTANGVSGAVATPTTTPAITLTLGAITPTSIAATGGITSTTGIVALGGNIVTSSGNINSGGTVTASTPIAAASGGTGLSTGTTAGNVLTWNGTDWVSSPSSGGGVTFGQLVNYTTCPQTL